MDNNVLIIDGSSMTVERLMSINEKTQIDLSPEAWEAIRKSRKVVDDIILEGKTSYGINTGFGNFADVVIPPEKLCKLQENLIRSHAAGVGNFLPRSRTKRLLALRINVLSKGYSGISEETTRRIIAFFNANVLSVVPEQGTLGASGDLAPLAHLALGMLGEGEVWHPTEDRRIPAAEGVQQFGLQRLDLKPKEGLALINGTQLIAALGAEAIWRSENLVACADAITALTLEALEGSVKAFFPEIHRARPHQGQTLSAKRMRSLLHSSVHPSQISLSHINCKKVQDAYSLRCAPQVHGVVYDTITFVKGIIETEMNSATDNPMVFSDTGTIVSGGNFHGEYPSKALDFLTIAVHELSNISERRVERLVNSTLSGLPAFLVEEGGLNSGFMIAHCTSAALTSENKTLTHPASVDTIPTSAEKEDHVSMGGWAARKCLQVVANVETVLAIEYLAAAQGLHLRRPLQSTEPVESIYKLLRETAGVGPWGNDRYMNPDILAARKLIEDRLVKQTVTPFWDNWDSLDQGYNFMHEQSSECGH